MKTVQLILHAMILFTCISTGLHAQFPAPVSFQFTSDYILLDSWGDCNGVVLFGPAYCSRFKWSPPDTSGIEATLDHYQIYINDVVFTQVEDSFYTIDQGFIGKFYVTAVYVNPNGESDSSNVVYNHDLPISTRKQYPPGGPGQSDRPEFIYDNSGRCLIVRHPGRINWLKIYSITGKEVLSATDVGEKLDVSPLGYGVYIIEAETMKKDICRQKIVFR